MKTNGIDAIEIFDVQSPELISAIEQINAMTNNINGELETAPEFFFSLSPSTLNALQDHANESSESMQAIVEQAVKSWIATKASTPTSN